MKSLSMFLWAAMVSGVCNAGTVAVNTYFVVGIEYSDARTIVGADVFGPTSAPGKCAQAMAALASQQSSLMPKGHEIISTCLHVKFNGPLGPHGAVIVQPFSGTPLAFLLTIVDYDAGGNFVGAKVLHSVEDVDTCKKQAQELIDDNVALGHILPGASAIIYCVPVPVWLQADSKATQSSDSETI